MSLIKQFFQKLHKKWMSFAEVLGLINSTILLSVIYILFILPLGLVMRFIGYDPLRKKLNLKQKSYFIDVSGDDPVQTIERPF